MNKNLKCWLRRRLPRAIRPHRILTGPLRGSQIVTSWHDYPAAILGYTESPLIGWFKENVVQGETWLDIGAHYGYTAIALNRLVGKAGRVFAFEPTLSTAGSLVQTGLLNHFTDLTVVPVALGAPLELKLCRLPTVRGMADSTVQCGESFETILVARLDWLWPQICGVRKEIEGVKIDVQGMETEVLEGMSNLLRQYRPKLVVEFHHGVIRERVLDLIEAAGYTRRGIPIEPTGVETAPQYIDNQNYAFQ
jgi:FkbM family methyltransferase